MTEPYDDDPTFYRPSLLERAIARENFRRQIAEATVDELKMLVVALGQPLNEFVN